MIASFCVLLAGSGALLRPLSLVIVRPEVFVSFHRAVRLARGCMALLLLDFHHGSRILQESINEQVNAILMALEKYTYRVSFLRTEDLVCSL